MTPFRPLADLRAAEARAAADHIDLMARAGDAIADWVAARLAAPARVLAVAGSGNNGGDALVAAARLARRGFAVEVLQAAPPVTPEALAAQREARAAGIAVLSDWQAVSPPALALDGLFGIGLSRPLADEAQAHIRQLNALGCPILALDCPSGLDAFRGVPLPAAVRATATLTFLADKPGLHTGDGPDYAGKVDIAGLDVPDAWWPQAPDGALYRPQAAQLQALRRERNSHKGRFGTVAVLGGDSGMTGAVLLAARAALLLGAGKVRGGLLDPALAVDPLHPELMLADIHHACTAADVTVLAAGPGLGQSEAAAGLLAQVLPDGRPLLLDADALNLIARDANLAAACSSRTAPTVLTPHPAEAARLLGCRSADVQANRVAAAQTLADRFNAVVVLKGAGSVVALPDRHYRINPTGNPGMAAAGQGDTLSGIIAALLAQGLDAFGAASLGAWLHGRAGDALAASQGMIGLSAGDTARQARAELNALLAPAL